MPLAHAALLLLSTAACDRQGETTDEQTDTTVHINMDARWGADDFVMENVYYDNYGNRIRVDNFMTYITMLKLVKSDGTEVLLKDFYLKDFEEETSLEFKIDPGIYTGIRFSLGIPPEYNTHIDPANYPSSHALSVAGSQGMFWTWNSGYIFSKFEGKADTTGTDGASLLFNYSYHTGDAACYMPFESTGEYFELKAGETSNINILFYVNEMLGSGPDGINVKTEYITSGGTPLGIKVASRMAGSIHIE